jgi:hypothetical protein
MCIVLGSDENNKHNGSVLATMSNPPEGPCVGNAFSKSAHAILPKTDFIWCNQS